MIGQGNGKLSLKSDRFNFKALANSEVSLHGFVIYSNTGFGKALIL